MHRAIGGIAILLTHLLLTPIAFAGVPPAGTAGYDALIAVMNDFIDWKQSNDASSRVIATDDAGLPIKPIADNNPGAIAQRLATLAALQDRMQTMDVAAWPRAQQVDWLAVRSRLDQQEYLLRLARPWARDPGYYVDSMLWLTFTELPVSGEALDNLQRELRAVPLMVREARKTLDDVAADYADLALHNLSNSDGVGHGYPYRASPPAGVIGWYDDLLARAQELQPDLVTDIRSAATAVREFDAWLKEQRQEWTASAGSGEVAFDWYLKHVKLMPWSSRELVVLGEREMDRLWSLYALEQHRNRHLPQLDPAKTAEDYQARISATDAKVRRFLKVQDIITVPADVGELDTNVPWIVRPGGRNFWEEIQFRDPSPDHLHAVIPGHRFDSLMAERQQHPIRKHITSDARVEGWATYLEEAMLQAGLFEDTPRVRELIQAFGIFRAARVPADVWLQTGARSAPEVIDYWLQRVPYLDANVARVDAEIYLRRPPGYGIGYTVGKLQVERLLADRKRQLGDDFELKAFHDYLMTAGRLPVSLLRWELTGLDDEVREFWTRDPLPAPPER